MVLTYGIEMVEVEVEGVQCEALVDDDVDDVIDVGDVRLLVIEVEVVDEVRHFLHRVAHLDEMVVNEWL